MIIVPILSPEGLSRRVVTPHDLFTLDPHKAAKRDGATVDRPNVCEPKVLPNVDRQDTSESSDNYRNEIFRNGRYRIALCKDGIQWLLQKQDRSKGSRWRSERYFTTRASIASQWQSATGQLTVPDEVESLPEFVSAYRRSGLSPSVPPQSA